jgi:hypothetical protein
MRLTSWTMAVFLAATPFCFAQSNRQSIPAQTTSGTGFTGAPYSGKETTVTEKILTDGTRTTETFVQLLPAPDFLLLLKGCARTPLSVCLDGGSVGAARPG